MTEQEDILEGLAAYAEQQATMRNARGPTAVPPELAEDSRANPAQREAASERYMQAILAKPASELTPSEIAALARGIADWSNKRA